MREFLQNTIKAVSDLEVSPEMADELLEEGKTYCSISFDENLQNTDEDKNATQRVSVLIYVKRRSLPTENTLQLIDTKADEVIITLKKANIYCSSYEQPSLDNIKRIRITGWGLYNEINNNLV